MRIDKFAYCGKPYRAPLVNERQVYADVQPRRGVGILRALSNAIPFGMILALRRIFSANANSIPLETCSRMPKSSAFTTKYLARFSISLDLVPIHFQQNLQDNAETGEF
jgi:hypothetical protein